MRRTLLLAATLVAIPVVAIAQEAVAPPPSLEKIVDIRQSKMGRGGGALAAMKQAVDSGADLTTLAPASNG